MYVYVCVQKEKKKYCLLRKYCFDKVSPTPGRTPVALRGTAAHNKRYIDIPCFPEDGGGQRTMPPRKRRRRRHRHRRRCRSPSPHRPMVLARPRAESRAEKTLKFSFGGDLPR